MGPIWGSVPCQKKSSCLWNKVFLGELFFPKENSPCDIFMVINCPYAGINKWMEIEILEIFQNLKNIARFNLNFFTRYKYIVIQKDSWINIHEWFGCNFPTWNIRNVWRARDDGHHYDVTSECCCVTITTRLVQLTRSISEIHVFFCCFQELSEFKEQMVTQIKYGIKAKRHGRSVLCN